MRVFVKPAERASCVFGRPLTGRAVQSGSPEPSPGIGSPSRIVLFFLWLTLRRRPVAAVSRDSDAARRGASPESNRPTFERFWASLRPFAGAGGFSGSELRIVQVPLFVARGFLGEIRFHCRREVYTRLVRKAYQYP